MTTAPSIIATCKQTRFHFLDDRPSREVDIQGLNIIVHSPHQQPSAETTATDKKPKGKSKAKADGLELISNADLRLKAGVHYGLVGRNGSGKSTILRALAEKLIPGVPYSTRIAILQQTDAEIEENSKNSEIDELADLLQRDGSVSTNSTTRKTALEQVIASDTMRMLSRSLEKEDLLAPVLTIRKLRHEQLAEQLFLAQKNASIRSGARGFQARKELKAIENRVAASTELLQEDHASIDAEAIQSDTQAAIDLLQDLQSQHEAMKVVDVENQARKILLGLGFKNEMLSTPFAMLSGGWRMRCMLAGILIQDPDIMILDEPTNFLDLLGVIWLENYLKQMQQSSGTTLVLVSHDRSFINAVCEEIIILRDQALTYFKGNLAAYEEHFEFQKLYWGRMKEAQEKQIAHMEATVRETTKVGKKTGDDNKLRMAKSRQKKLDERMGIQVSATGGRFKLNRDLTGFHLKARAEIEVPKEERGVAIQLPDAPDLRFPGPLISLENITFRYKRTKPVVLDDIGLTIHLGDRVGIMGLNGCGKSTLLKLLTGEFTKSTKGKVTRHPRLRIGYYAQNSVGELQKEGRLDPALTALAYILRDANGQLTEGETRGLLSSLGLSGRVASDVPVFRLSGGQLVRLALAKILWNHPHLLVLDEITTHLDFHTVTALASALSTFNGAILVVSHDRFLVRSVVEGKRDVDAPLDDDFEAESEGDTGNDETSRRRTVYVLKGGKMVEQSDGVNQFEKSLEKRVVKMYSSKPLNILVTMARPSVLGRGVSRLCYTLELPTGQYYLRRSTVTHRPVRQQSTVAATAAATVEDNSPDPPSSIPKASRRFEAIKSAKPFSDFLTDTFHRQHDYLRISITEKCNLRCLYCMPEEGVPLSPPAHLLTTPEIVYLSSLFVSQGVTKIRLTGGEPTVRKDLVPMMQAIGDLRKDGLKELCLTTNGISLHRKLDAMAEAGLTGVNLSLDTLDPFKYTIMTRRNGFEAVMKSINRIEEMNHKFNAGIKLKINCVVMRGLNEHEIVPFVEMGREKDIEVRFIEYMPFDGNKWSEQKMVPYQEMLDIIRKSYPELEKAADHKNDTSKTYRVPGFQGKVGFITSMTHNFCGTCNRLRITSDGNLKVCLHGNAEVSLRDLIREENNGLPIDDEAMKALDLLESGRLASRIQSEENLLQRERKLLDVIGLAVKRKKAKHAGIGKLENMKNRPMILIGG
uniref:GTP 3',8-cyclase n=1 Tax=Talaromyces marneffei PM1 TaxID=1077442 RepID=A0A093UVT7_TALMA